MPPDSDALSPLHQPVLLAPVLEHLRPALDPAPAGWVVDGTVGLGGHARAVLEAFCAARLLGLDRDARALALARERLAPYGDRVRLAHGSYADLAAWLARLGLAAPRAVLLDLGLSSFQLDDPARGFSFRAGAAAPDMRFDADAPGPTALDLVNHAGEPELARWLFEWGGEPRARAVARAIVRARPLATVAELAEVVRRHALKGRRHDPATRAFQALRMAVNDEPGHLARGLGAALGALADGGRLLVIAFHSGEERLVKEAFRGAQRAGRGRVVTRKPVRATEEEVRSNPRARPARLRVFETTTGGPGGGPDGGPDGGPEDGARSGACG